MFLTAGGYENPEWWSKTGWRWRTENDVREPALWHDGKWNAPSQPVVGVSYWEAEAFCAWAGGRLPTEQEWEAAARGPQDHEYPWGDDWEDGICSTAEAGVDATSPVGVFPRSRSRPFELEDMAGNVWEWTATDGRTEKTVNSGGESPRVLRGGSWNGHRGNARAAYRRYDHPHLRNNDIGFRVVCSSPISGEL